MSQETYILLKNSGSPRQGMLFDIKNRAMRFIINNEYILRKESLAKNFWVKITKYFGKKLS